MQLHQENLINLTLNKLWLASEVHTLVKVASYLIVRPYLYMPPSSFSSLQSSVDFSTRNFTFFYETKYSWTKLENYEILTAVFIYVTIWSLQDDMANITMEI